MPNHTWGSILWVLPFLPLLLAILFIGTLAYQHTAAQDAECAEATHPYASMRRDGLCYRATSTGGWEPVDIPGEP